MRSFLLVRDEKEGSETLGELVGFVHFRFTVKGEVVDSMRGDTCIFLWDIHLTSSFQRKGLGKHILTMLELIAAQNGIRFVSVPIQNADEESLAWIKAAGRGYAEDLSLQQLFGFDSQEEGFQVFSKPIHCSKKKNSQVQQVAAVSSPLPLTSVRDSFVMSPTSITEGGCLHTSKDDLTYSLSSTGPGGAKNIKGSKELKDLSDKENIPPLVPFAHERNL